MRTVESEHETNKNKLASLSVIERSRPRNHETGHVRQFGQPLPEVVQPVEERSAEHDRELPLDHRGLVRPPEVEVKVKLRE